MPCRRVVTERHMKAAALLVNGCSAREALTRAGYSRATAHNFGAFLRSCWGLRQAIIEEQERRREYLTSHVAPARRRRYNRRASASNVALYCDPILQQASTNGGVRAIYESTKNVEAGLPPKSHSPRDVSFDGKKMIPCGHCGRPVQQDKTFADPSGYRRICPSCAGV